VLLVLSASTAAGEEFFLAEEKSCEAGSWHGDAENSAHFAELMVSLTTTAARRIARRTATTCATSATIRRDPPTIKYTPLPELNPPMYLQPRSNKLSVR